MRILMDTVGVILCAVGLCTLWLGYTFLQTAGESGGGSGAGDPGIDAAVWTLAAGGALTLIGILMGVLGRGKPKAAEALRKP